MQKLLAIIKFILASSQFLTVLLKLHLSLKLIKIKIKRSNKLQNLQTM